MLKHLMAELIFMRGKGLSDSKFNKKYHLVHIMLLYVILCNVAQVGKGRFVSCENLFV